MKKFYISKRQGESGIYKYSVDFYELVLKDKGFVFLDSSIQLSSILSQIVVTDKVHIEIGIHLTDEVKILFRLIEKGYSDISVTLHDAPLIRFPFFQFNNSLLNDVSKAYDLFINKFSYQKRFLKKIKNIYVLTHAGLKMMKSKYKLDNIFFLPHIIDKQEIKKSTTNNFNFIYLGYIGKNKGIEYSLKLHQCLLKTFPDMKFYIVGKPLGRQVQFYEDLKQTFQVQTFFMGYISDDELNEVFERVTFSFLLFSQYKFYIPFSGSILYALKKGKIVFTTNTNAVNELIQDEKTGFYLSGDIDKDTNLVTRVLNNTQLTDRMKNHIYDTLLANYTDQIVSGHYRD